MKYTIIGILIILVLLYLSNNKENFTNNLICTKEYGQSHPRCIIDEENDIEHIGYFASNEIKYPVMRSISNGERYLFKNGKFYSFKKEFWEDSFYFKQPFHYSNLSTDLLTNFTYRGTILNNLVNQKFYIFGKKIYVSNYEYIIYAEVDGKLKYKYNIPLRKKLEDGDVVFIRKNSTTFGPFIFYKE